MSLRFSAVAQPSPECQSHRCASCAQGLSTGADFSWSFCRDCGAEILHDVPTVEAKFLLRIMRKKLLQCPWVFSAWGTDLGHQGCTWASLKPLIRLWKVLGHLFL